MKDVKFLVVLGMDTEQKPHAARFDIVDELAVRKAAELMGFRIGRAKSKEATELATKLTEGRIFETGRGLVPFVRADIYNNLVKLLDLEPTNASATSAPAASTPPRPIDPWALVKVGSVVLCQDPTPEPSWWECVVIAIGKDNRTLTVKWQNSPTLKPFKVKRAAIAILPVKN